MKILSGPEGDGLLTNVEVLEWLKEKNFAILRKDVPDGVIKPPSSTASLARNLQRFLEHSPSGAQTSKSARLLFEKLSKFNLSAPELMMIANIRPEAYAHLTALIADVYSRFDEDQIYEILEIVNATLEKRVKRKPPDDLEQSIPNHNNVSHLEQPQQDSSHVAPRNEPPDAEITDMSVALQAVQVQPEEHQQTQTAKQENFETGIDATITDYSAYAEMSTPDDERQKNSHRRATR